MHGASKACSIWAGSSWATLSVMARRWRRPAFFAGPFVTGHGAGGDRSVAFELPDGQLNALQNDAGEFAPLALGPAAQQYRLRGTETVNTWFSGLGPFSACAVAWNLA